MRAHSNTPDCEDGGLAVSVHRQDADAEPPRLNDDDDDGAVADLESFWAKLNSGRSDAMHRAQHFSFSALPSPSARKQTVLHALYCTAAKSISK